MEIFPARPDRPSVEVPLGDGMTLDELTDRLHVPADTEAVIVNGRHERPDYRLQPGDRVRIIRFMSGG